MTSQKNKIAIIIPYFGQWPEWIDLYFYSCRQNLFIDWLFFTDCPIPKTHSTNLSFYSCSFDEYCNDVSRKLKINFHPDKYYKLCDLKPFYGYIHADIISEYDFWGFGDIDVIWGNISKFYTNKLLSNYDVFSTHADRLSGHLAILKNKKEYTELGFKIKNWKQKLEDKSNYALDENNFSHLLYPESKYIKKIYSKIIRKLFNWRDAWVLYHYLIKALNFIFLARTRKLYFKEQYTTPILSDDGLSYLHDADTWFYHNGQITNNKTDREYIYLHFMIFKKNSFRETYFWEKNFYFIPKDTDKLDSIINKNGIFPYFKSI